MRTALCLPWSWRQRPRPNRRRAQLLSGADQRLQRLPHRRLSPGAGAPRLSEEQWLELARSASYRPPLPNHVLRIREDDLRSIHRFVSQLGEAGEPAPTALPPGQAAAGPVVRFLAP